MEAARDAPPSSSLATPERLCTKRETAEGARMRVLITGGAGFLGAWIVRRLAPGGHALQIFDLAENRGLLAAIAGERAADACEWRHRRPRGGPPGRRGLRRHRPSRRRADPGLQ